MINLIKVVELPSFPENSNPFHHDAYHMGTQMGSNITVMYENHSSDICKYLIICNTITGERIKLILDGTEDKPNFAEILVNQIHGL